MVMIFEGLYLNRYLFSFFRIMEDITTDYHSNSDSDCSADIYAPLPSNIFSYCQPNKCPTYSKLPKRYSPYFSYYDDSQTKIDKSSLGYDFQPINPSPVQSRIQTPIPTLNNDVTNEDSTSMWFCCERLFRIKSEYENHQKNDHGTSFNVTISEVQNVMQPSAKSTKKAKVSKRSPPQKKAVDGTLPQKRRKRGTSSCKGCHLPIEKLQELETLISQVVKDNLQFLEDNLKLENENEKLKKESAEKQVEIDNLTKIVTDCQNENETLHQKLLTIQKLFA